MAEQGEYFKNRKEAHNWLVAEGYQVSQGKFYQDISRNGFPALNGDKTVSKYQVMVYAKQLEEQAAPDLSAIERSENLHRKETAEAQIAEMKAERMRREEDANWLHADAAWSTLAALVGNLRDAIRRALHDDQVAIVQAAGGEVLRAPEVYEQIEATVDRAFNQVAGESIEVQWEGEE